MCDSIFVSITVFIFAAILRFWYNYDLKDVSIVSVVRLPAMTSCSDQGHPIFKMGQSYFYKYTVNSMTAKDQEEDHLFDISCNVEVHAVGRCQFILNTRNCQLFSKQDDFYSDLFSEEMDRFELHFSLNGDEIGHLLVHRNESLNILNIKRGIISTFITLSNNQMKDSPKITKKRRDTQGICFGHYSLETQSIVHMTKNILYCSSTEILLLFKLQQWNKNYVWGESCWYNYAENNLHKVHCVDLLPTTAKYLINYRPKFSRSLEMINTSKLIKEDMPNEHYRLSDIEFELDESSQITLQTINAYSDLILGERGNSAIAHFVKEIKRLVHIIKHNDKLTAILPKLLHRIPMRKISSSILNYVDRQNLSNALAYLQTKANVMMHISGNLLDAPFNVTTILPLVLEVVEHFRSILSQQFPYHVTMTHAITTVGLPLKIVIDGNASLDYKLSRFSQHDHEEKTITNLDLKMPTEFIMKEFVDLTNFNEFIYINKLKFEILNNVTIHLSDVYNRLTAKFTFPPNSQQIFKYSKQLLAINGENDESENIADSTVCSDFFPGLKLCRQQEFKADSHESDIHYNWILQADDKFLSVVQINVKSVENDAGTTKNAQLYISGEKLTQQIVDIKYSFNTVANLRQFIINVHSMKLVFSISNNENDGFHVHFEGYDCKAKNQEPYKLAFSQSLTDTTATIAAPQLSWLFNMKPLNNIVGNTILFNIHKQTRLNEEFPVTCNVLRNQLDATDNNYTMEAKISWLPITEKNNHPVVLRTSYQHHNGQLDFAVNFTNYNRVVVGQMNCTDQLSHVLDIVDYSNTPISKIALQFPLQYYANPFKLAYNFTSDVYSFSTKLIWDSSDNDFTKLDLIISAQSTVWSLLNVELKQYVANGGETMNMTHALMDIYVEGSWLHGYHKLFNFKSKVPSILPSMQWKLDCGSIHYCVAQITFPESEMDTILIIYKLSLNERSIRFKFCRNEDCKTDNSNNFLLLVELSLIDPYTIAHAITVNPQMRNYLMLKMNNLYNTIVDAVMGELMKEDHPIYIIKHHLFGNLAEDTVVLWSRLSETFLSDLVILFKPFVPVIESALNKLYLIIGHKEVSWQYIISTASSIIVKKQERPELTTKWQLPIALHNFTSVMKPLHINPQLLITTSLYEKHFK